MLYSRAKPKMERRGSFSKLKQRLTAIDSSPVIRFIFLNDRYKDISLAFNR